MQGGKERSPTVSRRCPDGRKPGEIMDVVYPEHDRG